MKATNHLNEPVCSYIRKDTILLSEHSEIEKVIGIIRTNNVSDQITYFYVADEEQRLIGILPIRRLLSAHPNQLVKEIMVPKVITIIETDTIKNAQKLFNTHKFLSLPVVNKDGKFVGVFDITVLTGKNLNFSSNHRFDEIFETIGVRASILQYLTPFRAFRHRFPWLIPTILTGICCAVLSSFFEQTISKSIILTFFLTLILGLGESVSIQTLTITVRRLQIEKPSWKWYLGSIGKELLTALFLGSAVAITLFSIIFFWKHELLPGLSIGISVILSLCTAVFFGISIPAILHKTRLDPKVAAGPLVLGLADLFTLLFYFSLASIFL